MRPNVGLGYLDPGDQGRRRDEGGVPRRHDDDRLDRGQHQPDPPDLRPDPAQAHLREDGLQADRRRPRSTSRPTAAGSSGPGLPARRVQVRTSPPGSSGTPTTGASRARRTRSSCSSSARTTPCSRRSRPARSTTPGSSARSSSSSSQSDPAIKTVNGVSNGWTELGFNTYGTGTGKTIKGGGPSTKALQDPKFRDALGYAIDKQKLVDNVIGGFGTIGSTQIPPVMKDGAAGIDWHADPTDTADLRHRGCQAEARRRGLCPGRQRQPARQGRQADQPEAGPARLRPELRQGRPVHQGLVRRARDQGDPEGLRERRAWST